MSNIKKIQNSSKLYWKLSKVPERRGSVFKGAAGNEEVKERSKSPKKCPSPNVKKTI